MDQKEIERDIKKKLKNYSKPKLILYTLYIILGMGFHNKKIYFRRMYWIAVINTLKYQIKNYKTLGQK